MSSPSERRPDDPAPLPTPGVPQTEPDSGAPEPVECDAPSPPLPGAPGSEDD